MGKLPLKFRDRGSIFIGFIFAAPVVIALVIYGIWFATHSSARALVCEVAKKAATSFVEQNHDFVSLDQAKIAAENTAADYAASLGLIDGSGTTELYPLIVSQYTIPASERIAYATVLLPAQAARVGRVSDGGQAGASGSSYTDPKTGRTVVVSDEAPNAASNNIPGDVDLPAPPPPSGSPIVDEARFLAENLPSKAVAVGSFSFLGFTSTLNCTSVTSAVINSSSFPPVIPPAPPTPGFPPAAPPAGGGGGAGGAGAGGTPGAGGGTGAIFAGPASDCGDGSAVAQAEASFCGGESAAWMFGVKHTETGAPQACAAMDGSMSASCCTCMTQEEAMASSRFNNVFEDHDPDKDVKCVYRGTSPEGLPSCGPRCWVCITTPKFTKTCDCERHDKKTPNPDCGANEEAVLMTFPAEPGTSDTPGIKAHTHICCAPKHVVTSDPPGEPPGVPVPSDPQFPSPAAGAGCPPPGLCPQEAHWSVAQNKCVSTTPTCPPEYPNFVGYPHCGCIGGDGDYRGMSFSELSSLVEDLNGPCPPGPPPTSRGLDGVGPCRPVTEDAPEPPVDNRGSSSTLNPAQIQTIRSVCVQDGSEISCPASVSNLLIGSEALVPLGPGVAGNIIFGCAQSGQTFSLASGSCSSGGPSGPIVGGNLSEPSGSMEPRGDVARDPAPLLAGE